MNRTSGFEQARLFIAVDKIEEFKKNPQQDGKYLFVVTDQYRYGQEDGEGKNRFLVYHDPSRVVFMVSLSQRPYLTLPQNDIGSLESPWLTLRSAASCIPIRKRRRRG